MTLVTALVPFESWWKELLITVCAVLSFNVQSACSADVPSFSLPAIWSINAGPTHTLIRLCFWPDCLCVGESLYLKQGTGGWEPQKPRSASFPFLLLRRLPGGPMVTCTRLFFSPIASLRVSFSLYCWDFLGFDTFRWRHLLSQKNFLIFFPIGAFSTHNHSNGEKQCYQLSWFLSITPQPEATNSSRVSIICFQLQWTCS